MAKKTRLLSLAEMRAAPELATMRVLPRGNRLSITPVDAAEWQNVLRRLESAPHKHQLPRASGTSLAEGSTR